MSEPTQPTVSKPPDVAVEDDSDPDFDDLDDVLDQFSAATSSQQPSAAAAKSQHEPTPSSSGPGRPVTDTTALPSDIPIPSGPKPNESEDEFLARLTAEMSTVMSKFSMDPAASAASPEDIAKMGQELEEFTQRMEAEGIQPEDMLKAILGEEAGNKVVDVAEKERDRRESQSTSKSRSPEKSRIKDETSTSEASSSKPKSSKSKSKSKPTDSFEDTIRKTMARMESSSAAASDATQKSTATKSEEDMLAEMLRALDSEGRGGAGGGESEGDLSKMFLGLMEQLTNKEMLYEPMKELSTKFPAWLAENNPSSSTATTRLTQAEHDRFTRQHVIVDEIVAKFEEKGYSDEDPTSREFIWEKMQQMQGEGAPPEELVANPFPGMGMPGLGLGDGAEGLEEGCPTQ